MSAAAESVVVETLRAQVAECERALDQAESEADCAVMRAAQAERAVERAREALDRALRTRRLTDRAPMTTTVRECVPAQLVLSRLPAREREAMDALLQEVEPVDAKSAGALAQARAALR